MGDSYERIQEKAEVEVLRLRAKLILEVESFFGDAERGRKEWFPKWLHVLLPKGAVAVEAQGTVLKSVKTRVEGLREEMREMKKQMAANQVEVRKQMAANDAEVKAQMKSQLSAILEAIGASS